jgi:amidase
MLVAPMPATIAGCPAINVPAGFSTMGLPMGIHILGPCGADLGRLQIARAYESATNWAAINPSPIPSTCLSTWG